MVVVGGGLNLQATQNTEHQSYALLNNGGESRSKLRQPYCRVVDETFHRETFSKDGYGIVPRRSTATTGVFFLLGRSPL